MTIEEWKEQSQNKGISIEELAELSGIPVEIVDSAIWGREIPKFMIWERLDAILQQYPTSEEGNLLTQNSPQDENIFVHKSYTVDDYLAVPEGLRVELIDGIMYDKI